MPHFCLSDWTTQALQFTVTELLVEMLSYTNKVLVLM